MRARGVHFMLVLLMLVQPVVAMASACEKLLNINESTATLDTPSESPSSITLAASSGAEHVSCHDLPVTPESEATHCLSCESGASCSSGCTATASVLSITPYGGVAPYHADFPIDEHFSLISNSSSGLYRPPRQS